MRDLAGLLLVVAVVSLLALILLWPRFNVYRKTMNGMAQLEEARYTRQIAALDAQADSIRAVGFAKSEVQRAYGVAESDSIISGGLKGETEYLTYLNIQAIKEGNCSVIYLPNDLLPMTEALRLSGTSEP